jgi:hypothetical protein
MSIAIPEQIEWQVPVCGIIFLALGIGNLATTIQTYTEKFKHKTD